MKSTRRMLALVLCLVMCLALLPASASAANILASGQAGAAAEFILYTDGRLVVSGSGSVGAMTTWSFTSGFDGGYSSTNDAVAATRSAVKTLEIGEGITQLGANAFRECPNLTSVVLPLSLTDGGGIAIGQSAFEACSALDDVYIPANVQTIGSRAFYGCSNLKSLYLSDGLQTIQPQAFMDCVALPTITFPANVTLIDDQAFANCNSLKTIYFTGNYTAGMFGGVFDNFAGVRATVYYPVDNDSWNNAVPTAFQDWGGGRFDWKPQSEYTASDGWVQKNGAWYYYMGGKMVRNNWVAYEGRWFYFGDNGRMYQNGRQQVGDKFYYFDPATGARLSGWQAGDFYDDNGVWQPAYSGVDDTGLNLFQKGWQLVNGKWYYVKNQAKVTGWLKWKKNWYYLDPTSGAMVTGWLDYNGKTYYLRPADIAARDGMPEGSMISGRSESIGNDGTVYTFDSEGALKGGRMDQNPLGLTTGFRQDGPNWKFYRSDGSMAKSKWELVNSTWYYFDKNGNMKTGWLKWEDHWYYLTPGAPPAGGAMVTGIQTIPTTKDGLAIQRTYYFKSNGALNGKGWVKQNNKWYYLNTDGTIATGWLRDGNKWYYLRDDSNPIGEMVTGVYDVPSNGGTNNPSGTQSFKANGEWIGAGAQVTAGVAASWVQDANGWRYIDTNGNPVTGWQQVGGKWYYMDPGTTYMVTGFRDIGGNRFFFDNSGAMLSGWQNLSGVWYYFNPSHDGTFGAMLRGWQEIKKEWYYLDPNTGAMQTGWIENPAGSNNWYYLNGPMDEGTTGAMHGGGWMKVGGKWYYMNPNHDGTYGRELQGWQNVSGKWYYMREDGNPAEGWMVTGRQQLTWNGVTGWYYFEGDGHMVANKTVDGHHYGPSGAEE